MLTATGEDFLPSAMNYSNFGKNQTSFIKDRRQVTAFADVPNVGPTSVRAAKFAIADTAGMIDLASVEFTFTVNNNSQTHPLVPLTLLAHNLWRRWTLRLGGSTIEDICHFSRHENMLSMLMSYEKRLNMCALQYGTDATGSIRGNDIQALSIPAATGAGPGTRQIVWRPLSSGLLNSGMALPAFLLGTGLQVVLEVADADEAFRHHADTSQDYTISDLRVIFDSLRMTEEIMESYSSMLLSGKSIFLSIQAWDVQEFFNTVLTGEVTVTTAKQYSRLNSMWVTMDRNTPSPVATNDHAGTMSTHVNRFYLPAGSQKTIETFLNINSQRWPDHSTIGTAQHMHRLFRALGTGSSIAHSTNISASGYGRVAGTASNQFIMVADVDAAGHMGASHSGQSVNTGGIVSVHLKNIGGGGDAPTRITTAALHDLVIEITDTAARVYS